MNPKISTTMQRAVIFGLSAFFRLLTSRFVSDVQEWLTKRCTPSSGGASFGMEIHSPLPGDLCRSIEGRDTMFDWQSCLIGSVVTLICSYIPASRATKQLSAEAERLANLSILITRGLEESGFAKFNRDTSGYPIGLVIEESIKTEIPLNQNAKT